MAICIYFSNNNRLSFIDRYQGSININGTIYSDSLSGNDKNNIIFGFDQNDKIYGGRGN
jgi:Ca2+-binding RTX toxin-like protein